MQIRCSSRSIILNATATQYMCSLNGIYCPPLTSIEKSSLFTHAHSSPLSLAAKLHQCHANHSFYINNGWTFSGQMSYTVLVGSIVHRTHLLQNISQDECSVADSLWKTQGILGHNSPSRTK